MLPRGSSISERRNQTVVFAPAIFLASFELLDLLAHGGAETAGDNSGRGDVDRQIALGSRQ